MSVSAGLTWFAVPDPVIILWLCGPTKSSCVSPSKGASPPTLRGNLPEASGREVFEVMDE